MGIGSKVWLWLAVALIQAGTATCIAAEPKPADTPISLRQAAPEDFEPLLEAAASFRQSARLDFVSAVARFAAPEGAAVLHEISRTVWNGVDAAVGWSHFMSVSLIVAAGGTTAAPVVAYYSPWSDVFLVTQWVAEPEGLRVRDAELLLGDWVRRRGAPPLDATPLWLRGPQRLQAAPAIAAADSILAFEATFTGWDGRDWRARIGGFADARQVTENRLGAGLAMGLAIDNGLRFLAGDGGESGLQLRLALERLRREFSAGHAVAALRSAKETSPTMQKLLRNIPGEEFKALLPAAAFVEEKAGIVFMVPRREPDYFIAFRFKRSGEPFVPSRVDFVSYQQVYDWRRAGGLPRGTGAHQ